MPSSRTLCTLMLCFFMSACSSLQHTKTGFLDNYELLKPSDEYPDTLLYRSAQFDKAQLQQISTIYLPKFEVWLTANDNAEFLSVNQSHIVRLSNYMQSQLKKKLSSYYQVVTNKPVTLNDQVLTIKGAFTNIDFQETSLDVRDFVPVKLVYNAGKTAYLAATEQTEAVTSVSLESAFYMGNGVQPVFMMTASKQLESVVKANGAENVEAVKAILDIWINNFVTGMTNNKMAKN
ncbi:DUF3313 domain-containing protein [Pseudoalteromonas citrea]|uniref:DUF3313 domain-containing protein n=1 Tax=Pseudoalteromonas citrea TaxID=43655 RepID=A0A5S3XLK9_9GAMM|nr:MULTISPECIES: DUF3313 family protein [Pseudoalteromonas]RJE77876.1 hypothetical protein BGP78_07145 [Pseudoalteromonas sp. MSK9-3]TMP41526.1 DUF3313 domain-containing protein [Pseudoalteromonas citrea]TMP56421.1 DUF3313 domain-containing protein [Pseudoalteromonas citrea]